MSTKPSCVDREIVDQSIPGRFAQFILPDHFLPSVQFAKSNLAQQIFRQSINRPISFIYLRVRKVTFKCIKRLRFCQETHLWKECRCLNHYISCEDKCLFLYTYSCRMFLSSLHSSISLSLACDLLLPPVTSQ